MIWIEVEGFRPRRVLGTGAAPQMYVWVGRKQHGLAQRLAAAIEEDAGETVGDIDHRETGYVVTQPVRKCVPGEVEGYDESVRRQITGFFAHYAEVLSKLDGLIQEHIAGMEKGASEAGM